MEEHTKARKINDLIKTWVHMNVVPRSTRNTIKSSPTFSVRPCSSVGRVTVDLFRRSWLRFPPRSKDFFFGFK